MREPVEGAGRAKAPWRWLIGLGVAVLLAGVLVAALLVVRFTTARKTPAPAAAAASPAPPAPPAPDANAASIAPPAPEPPRQLSWEGLSVRPYRGRFAGDYAVQKVTAGLEQDLMDALKDLKDGTGLFPTSLDRVVFEPRDSAECSFRGPYEVERADEGGALRVVVAVEPLVLRWYPPRKLLASALGEAILTREAPAFAGAPSWLRHGMALYLSRFGEFVERRALLEEEGPVLRKVRPLAESGDDAWAMGYWAFRSQAGRRGEASVTALADALRFAPDWSQALRTTGEEPGAFESSARSWATAHLRDLCANREEFLDMAGLLRREEEVLAIPRLEAFVRERPLDLYAGDARYFHAYALYRTGEYDGAIRAFTDLLHNAPYSTTKQGKAHFFMGRCYQALRYAPLAQEQYQLSRMDPGSPLLAQMAAARLEEVR